MPGHFLPDVCPEIYPLVWRPEPFRLTHQLFISNQAEIARRRGTRKLRTYQSGINEEHVLRGKGRGNRTYVLLILEKYINNLSGTDGHRTIGRTWHASRWRDASLAEAICSSTRNTLPLPHPKMIRSLLPLTIPYWYLCLATPTLYLVLVGRSRSRHGKPCSSVSSKGNRSVTSRVITAFRMRQSGVCCGLLVASKWCL